MDEIVDSTIVIFVVMREYKYINRAHTSPVHDRLNATSDSVLATIHQQGLPSRCDKQGCTRLLDIARACRA
jgi:hypothetical protein